MANPVTLAEVQQHLRLGTLDTAEQAEINTMIDAATEHAEAFCNRGFRSGTKTEQYDAFPSSESQPFVLFADAQSVSTVSYYDTENVQQTYGTTRLINRGGRSYVYPAFGAEWPTDSNELPYNITVTFVDVDEASVPASVKQAIMLLIGDMYENRENSVTGQGVTHVKMTLTAERLLTPFKTRLA